MMLGKPRYGFTLQWLDDVKIVKYAKVYHVVQEL